MCPVGRTHESKNQGVEAEIAPTYHHPNSPLESFVLPIPAMLDATELEVLGTLLPRIKIILNDDL